MNWKSLLTKIEADVKQMKEKIYPDMTWKPESIPTRKEWNTLSNLIMTMEKDFLWIEEYKNPVKKERKLNYVELSEEFGKLLKLKEKGLSCYPDRYVIMFINLYLFANECLNKNKVIDSKLPEEFKKLFPLKDGDTIFCVQTFLKDHIVMENGKRKVIVPSPEEQKMLQEEVDRLKKLKELKSNREEFMNVWNDFYKLKN